MAYYAFLDENNIVVEVIRGIDETELIDGLNPEIWYGDFKNLKCVRTSFNGKIRKNYAGIGYKYDSDLDAFIPPKPYASWSLDEQTCLWVPPVPYPVGGFTFTWDEEIQEWVEV